jgi:hypothetical protein
LRNSNRRFDVAVCCLDRLARVFRKKLFAFKAGRRHLAKDIKVLAHIDSKLDHGFATTKLAADFLVCGQLNVITILHGSGEFSDSPALLHVI